MGRQCGVIKGDSKLGRTLSITLRITPASLSILVVKRDKINGRVVPEIVRSGSPQEERGCFTVGYNDVPRKAVSDRLFKRRGNSFAKTVNRDRNCFKVTGGKAVFLSRMKRLPVRARTQLLHILRANRCVQMKNARVQGAGIHVMTTAGIGVHGTIDRKEFHRSLCCHLGAVPVRVPPLHRHNNSVLLLFHLFTVRVTRGCRLPGVSLSRSTGRLVLGCG